MNNRETQMTAENFEPTTVRVWDPWVRIFHWSLLGLFVTAWASGDQWQSLHEVAGYAIAGLVVFRLVWGFMGSPHARFSDFVFRPSTVFTYLTDTFAMRAKRYLGHNPTGGAMVVALLFTLTLISVSGIMMTIDAFWGVEWVEEFHEFSVNLTLLLIALHVTGVAFASFEHGENLVRSMLTGRKRAD